MKMGKPVRVAIEDDFAKDVAARLVAKHGMPLLVATYRAQGKNGLDLFVRCELEPIGADTSEIDAVTLIVEQDVSDNVFMPAGTPEAVYSIFLPE